MPERRSTAEVPWLTAAALVGGLLWVVKGAAILLGYGQPEHAFEVAPLLFALAMAAVVGCLAAVVASIATGDVLGPDLLMGVVTMSAALMIVGSALRRSGAAYGGVALFLGVATIPAMLVGGAISTIDERLLEVPVVAIGLVWITLGLALFHHRKVVPRTTADASRSRLR